MNNLLIEKPFVVVGRVRGHDHGAARRVDGQRLQAARMARHRMQIDAGVERLVAIMEHDPVAVDHRHHLDDVGQAVRVAQPLVRHRPTCDERHLSVLQVKARVREQLQDCRHGHSAYG